MWLFKKVKAPLNLGKTNLHGLTKHPVYGRWNAMINRCENPNTLAYKNYGERGIKVCDEWHNLKEFIRWSEENGFSDKLTLERIDVNGNYEPKIVNGYLWKNNIIINALLFITRIMELQKLQCNGLMN